MTTNETKKRSLCWDEKHPAGIANINRLARLQETLSDEELATEFNTSKANIYNVRTRLKSKGLIEGVDRNVRVKRMMVKRIKNSKVAIKSEDIGTRCKALFGAVGYDNKSGLFSLSDEQLRAYRDDVVLFTEECVLWNGTAIVLDENQKEWLNDKSRLRICCKSTRIGITFANDIEAFWEALFFPGSVNLFVSTTEKRAKEQLETIYNFADSNPDLFGGIFIERPKDCATFTTGSKIYSLPNSPSGVRGIPQMGSIHSRIDEFAHFTAEDDEKMFAAMFRNLTLGEGRMSLWSTPFGKRGLFYKIWENDQNMFPDFGRHKLHWSRCPRVNRDTIAKLKRNTHPVVFKQEYENQFISTGEELFPLTLIQSCVRDNVLKDSLSGKNPTNMGVDFALGGGDSTSIFISEFLERSVFDRTVSKYVIRNITKMDTKRVSMITGMVISLMDKYTVDMCYPDETGMGRPLTFELQEKQNMMNKVEGITFTNPMKDKYIMRLWSLFNDGRIEIPNDVDLIKQLNGLQTTETKGGILSYDHVRGQHDDHVWALALSVFNEDGMCDADLIDIGVPVFEDGSGDVMFVAG